MSKSTTQHQLKNGVDVTCLLDHGGATIDPKLSAFFQRFCISPVSSCYSSMVKHTQINWENHYPTQLVAEVYSTKATTVMRSNRKRPGARARDHVIQRRSTGVCIGGFAGQGVSATVPGDARIGSWIPITWQQHVQEEHT